MWRNFSPFLAFLHNQPGKPLYKDTPVNTSVFQKKEGIPFIGTNSQYYQNNMYTEFPNPSSNGKYYGQFVYEYEIRAGKKVVYQLKKNLGG